MLEALNARRRRPETICGLTVVELLVVVAILAILLALAIPFSSTYLAQGRLGGAAEALAQDLQLAKSEALRRNADVTISFSSGSTWCYGSVVGATACNCTVAGSCTLRRVDQNAYTGVTMAAPTFTGSAATFTSRQGLANAGAVEFSHPNAGTLRVSLGVAGRVSICSTAGALAHHPAC